MRKTGNFLEKICLYGRRDTWDLVEEYKEILKGSAERLFSALSGLAN
ncbi:hypothetical protein [Butyrivibrio sp. VCD2006]|nr:hypothetical protein [Butyrivibrio sp. VCD2006]